MSGYPEHEKLAKISDKSQAIGEFIDWLQNEKGYTIAKPGDGDETFEHRLYPAHVRITDLLAEFFEIDQRAIEQEKRAMLAAIRAADQS